MTLDRRFQAGGY